MSFIFRFLPVILFLCLPGLVGAADAGTSIVSGQNIQAALNQASSGDTVIIQAGDYYITSPLTASGKDLTIKGSGTIHFDCGQSWGLVLSGTKVVSTSPRHKAVEGDTEIQLKDVTGVKPGQLLSIYNSQKWAPLDQPKQRTGEMYLIVSVSGDTVTLNEPLIRSYTSSDSVEIHEPIEVHLEGLTFINSDATVRRSGVDIKYAINSVVSGCTFKNHGSCAVKLSSCWESTIKNCKVYDGLMPGNGYGYCVADGSAYCSIVRNYAENCRHTVCLTAVQFKTLNREITISGNTLIGADITDSNVVDSHEMSLSWTIKNNVIVPKENYKALSDGAYKTTFVDNEIYGLEWRKRGHIKQGSLIINNNLHDDEYEGREFEDAEEVEREVTPDIFHVLEHGFSFPMIENDLGAAATVVYNNVSADPHSLIEVEGNDLKLIKFEYDGNVSRYFIEEGIWTGDLDHVGSELYIPGEFNADSLRITVYSDEGYQQVTDIKIIERKLTGASSISPDLFIFISVLAILGISIARNLRRVF